MIRYGIVGYGMHAARRLMPALAESQSSRAVALARRDISKGRKDAEQFRVPHVFESTQALCECSEVDAVIVTSPNSLHCQDVLLCLEHDKHVLCEKPMAVNVAQSEEMVAAARHRGLLLGVAQSYRFCPSLARIRNLVQERSIGSPVGIRVDFTFFGLQSDRRWLHDATLAGGGPIADIGIHAFDTMRYILCDEPVSCAAITVRDEHSCDVEATAAILLRFSGGALGTSMLSYRAPYHTHIEVLGTGGSIIARDGLTVDWPLTLEIYNQEGSRVEEISNEGLYVRQIDAFTAAIETGKPFPATGEDGLQNQRILDALYESAALGREVQISKTHNASITN